MNIVSDKFRNYIIGENKHIISNKIIFDNNCEIEYSQNKINSLYEHIKLFVTKILNKFIAKDYWAIGGTLLGIIRHEGIIVWDDDADFAITLNGFNVITKNLYKINKIMRNFDNNYELCEYVNGYKLFYDNNCIMDLFVVDYLQNNVNVKETKLVYSGPIINGKSTFISYTYLFPFICFKKKYVFPLKQRKCEDFNVNVPNNSKKILYNNYNKKCLTIIKATPVIHNLSHSLINDKRLLYTFTEFKNIHYNKYPFLNHAIGCFYLTVVYNIFSQYKDKNETSVVKYRKKVLKQLFKININQTMSELTSFIINERNYIQKFITDVYNININQLN